MVDQLNSFAAEVTRVAREVGTEGKLGGQADVRGVAGTWKDLTDRVNSMASNLTPGPQHRTGDDGRRERRSFTQDHGGRTGRDSGAEKHHQHHGGPAEFVAAEVTRVAREVGTEGKLGGQAEVKGVGGVWKDLTDSVNQMAGEPDHAGSRYREGRDGGREWRSEAKAGARNEGRDRRACGDDQRHDRYAGGVRRPGDECRPRSRYRRKAGRAGACAGGRGHLAGSYGQRQPDGGDADHAGSRDRGGRDRGDEGRPDAADHCGSRWAKSRI